MVPTEGFPPSFGFGGFLKPPCSTCKIYVDKIIIKEIRRKQESQLGLIIFEDAQSA